MVEKWRDGSTLRRPETLLSQMGLSSHCQSEEASYSSVWLALCAQALEPFPFPIRFPPMTRSLSLGVFAIGMLMVQASHAQSTLIVSQESAPGVGDFDDHVLGSVEVFQTAGTIAAFYNYHSNKYNGPVPTFPADKAAFYAVSGSDGLALFGVYDRTSTTGGQSQATFQYTVSNAAFSVPLAVQDDDNDPNDSFTFGAGNTVLDHTARWNNGATDGFAATFTGPSPSIIANPVSFNSFVTGWNVLSSDGNHIPLVFTAGRRAKLTLAEGNHQMPNETVAGWRLLSAPVSGMTVDDLAAINLVQGVPAGTVNGQQYPGHAPNLFHQYDGYSTGFLYTPVPDADYTFEPGRGIWWYWYNLDLDPTGSGAGTSVSRELTDPNAALVYSGAPAATNVNTTFVRPANDNGFYMGGNPFTLPFAVDGISSDVGDVQTVVSSWSPTLQSHVQYFFENPSNGNQPDYASVWQGLLIEVTDGGFPIASDPTLTYAYASTSPSESPIFHGKGLTQGDPTPHFHFRLDGFTASRHPVSDHGSWIRFRPDAELGWDRHDGSKLMPGGQSYALIAPTIAERGQDPVRLAVMSLPDGTAGPLPRRLDIPLMFLATDPGTYTLSWGGGMLPTGWQALLIDRETGTRVRMWRETSYSFESDATDWDGRFFIRFRPAQTADALANSQKAAGPSLSEPYPNPANTSSRILLDLDETQAVTVRVVDALGREIAVVHDGELTEGAHTLVVPVTDLAPGSYALLVEGATVDESRRLLVVR